MLEVDFNWLSSDSFYSLIKQVNRVRLRQEVFLGRSSCQYIVLSATPRLNSGAIISCCNLLRSNRDSSLCTELYNSLIPISSLHTHFILSCMLTNIILFFIPSSSLRARGAGCVLYHGPPNHGEATRITHWGTFVLLSAPNVANVCLARILINIK